MSIILYAHHRSLRTSVIRLALPLEDYLRPVVFRSMTEKTAGHSAAKTVKTNQHPISNVTLQGSPSPAACAFDLEVVSTRWNDFFGAFALVQQPLQAVLEAALSPQADFQMDLTIIGWSTSVVLGLPRSQILGGRAGSTG
jgi:hypothetical protein